MRTAGYRTSSRLILLAVPILLAGGLAFAGNIDPNSDGSKYAWAENLGGSTFSRAALRDPA